MSPLPTLPSRRSDTSEDLDLELREEDEVQHRGPLGRARGLLGRVRGTTGDEDTTNWSDGKRITAVATTAGLWALLAFGAAGAGWTFLADEPEAVNMPAIQAEAARLSDREDAAREAAVEMVSVWASSTDTEHDRLAQLVGEDALAAKLPAKPVNLQELRSMDADAVGPGVWSVSVSALVEGPDGWQRQAFEVPVMVAGGGEEVVAASAMTLPAQVPLNAEIADLPATPYTQPLTNGPVLETTEVFLRALLTGQDGMDRVTAPETDIVAISPAPYARVDVESAAAVKDADLQKTSSPADGRTVHLSVRVRMHTTDSTNSAGRPGQYLLTLTSRAGRWEVSSIDDLPATPINSNTNTQE